MNDGAAVVYGKDDAGRLVIQFWFDGLPTYTVRLSPGEITCLREFMDKNFPPTEDNQ